LRRRQLCACTRQSHADLVYAAYQRGQYKTAFDLATKRAQENGDPKAMTMLGELYATRWHKRDYAKAADWYKRAATAETARPCLPWRCSHRRPRRPVDARRP